MKRTCFLQELPVADSKAAENTCTCKKRHKKWKKMLKLQKDSKVSMVKYKKKIQNT